MRRIISLLSAVIISVVSFAGISNAADSKKPIVIPTHNWSSQIVMAYVIGGIMESMGNNVKYVNADSQAVYESIRIGDVTYLMKYGNLLLVNHSQLLWTKADCLTGVTMKQEHLKTWDIQTGLLKKDYAQVYQTGLL